IEPDQEGLISIDDSNEPENLEGLKLSKVKLGSKGAGGGLGSLQQICLHFKPDAPVIDNFNELNEDQRGSEIIFLQNVEDDESVTSENF
ncbi:hypothetical protein Tco_0330091, partial [Tanacetum coccineum]